MSERAQDGQTRHVQVQPPCDGLFGTCPVCQHPRGAVRFTRTRPGVVDIRDELTCECEETTRG